MWERLGSFLSSEQYIPHGHCYLWQTPLVELHLVSDLLIAIAYFSIPAMLIYFICKRSDVPFLKVFILFSAFIILCGTGHLLDVWTLWHPAYWLTGFEKATTALVSCYTALQLVELLPKFMSLRTPEQLEAINRALQKEIVERQYAEQSLRFANEQLEQRTAELQQALELESALKRITDKVRDSLDESQIMQIAVAELTHLLKLDCCDTALNDAEQRNLLAEPEACLGSPIREKISQLIDSPDIKAQLLQGHCLQLCVREFDQQPDTIDAAGNTKEEKHNTILTYPIMDDQGVIGNLWLSHRGDRCFNDLEVRLVRQVANQCAIALRQARLYQAAQAQVEELEKLNRLKDDFLSTVSHELRTPMSNIKLSIHMLELVLQRVGAFNADPDVSRYFKILQHESQQEIQLINNLLDLTRLDSETEPLVLTSIPLDTWILSLVEPFIERAKHQLQNFQIHLAPNLPLLTTDLSYLGRALTELLNNACKYTPAGETITLTGDVTAENWLLKVCNSGIEITSAERDRIFDKFYRIPNNDPWKHGGTGLGLALVKKLVERLRGRIQVESSNNQTTFVLKLPVVVS
ncbi:MAG: GAF domain-containing sensor histidine kinase [Leptolyngbyaceae cyanobacterium bins.302]|nr:GAF domain-containing sensor histidine kinase [Leptolyngbyaceae cyanobacterium bins.302]